MSNIYVQEPPTTGKVLLVTTSGDIDIELWSKEAPKACRNFVQLCLDGYYDNTIIHRIIKGFIAQGGDPTGTGEGGESIYGAPFKDEFHQRLKFNRRGLVAMANAGPNDNGSQFFFTLDRCDHLNSKHTIFGKVTGPTLYNMLQLADRDVGANDRPHNPPAIKRTEVLANPFADVERRAPQKLDANQEAESTMKSKSRATKNFSLLSFGEEAEDDEEEITTVSKSKKIVSSHDVLNDPKLSSQSVVTDEQRDAAECAPAATASSSSQLKRKKDGTSDQSASDGSDDEQYNAQMKQRVSDKLRQKKKVKEDKPAPGGAGDDAEFVSPQQRETNRKIADLRREALLLKKSMLKKGDDDEEDGDGDKEEKAVSSAVQDYRKQLTQYGERKKSQIKKGGSREAQALALLAKFSNRVTKAGSGDAEETSLSHLAKYSDDDADGDGGEKDSTEQPSKTAAATAADGEDDSGWLSHSLVCEETVERIAKDASTINEDTYAITDPRHPINKRRRKAEKQRREHKGFNSHRR